MCNFQDAEIYMLFLLAAFVCIMIVASCGGLPDTEIPKYQEIATKTPMTFHVYSSCYGTQEVRVFKEEIVDVMKQLMIGR